MIKHGMFVLLFSTVFYGRLKSDLQEKVMFVHITTRLVASSAINIDYIG